LDAAPAELPANVELRWNKAGARPAIVLCDGARATIEGV
jgi:hypothetical protein